ncbi:MAG: tetratricopeptide repeat protein [Gemmatimonadaceae bacterium]
MPAPDPASAHRRGDALLPAVAALAALLVFARSVGNGFAYDDVLAISQNPLLHGFGTLPAVVREPYWPLYGTLYRPLTLLSFGIEWSLSGGRPWLSHLINVLWHALATALVCRLAARWLPPAGALAAGLAFALHPVHAEAVANVVGRSELVCAAMLLAMSLVVARAGDLGRGRAAALAALAALALASKETGVVAPAVAFGVAWAYPPARAAAGRAAAAASIGVVPLLVARYVVLGTLRGDTPHPAFQAASPPEHALLVLGSLARATWSLLVPSVPRIEWAPPLASVRAPSVALAVAGALVLAAVTAALVAHVRRPTLPTLALWIAAATLAPTANVLFPTGIVLAERTLYSPSIGACLLVGALAAAAWSAEGRAPRSARVAARVALLAWGAAAALIVVPESAVWRDDDTVAAAMLARAPDSYRAQTFAGARAQARGDRATALRRYREAVRLFPEDATTLYAAASLAIPAGDTAAATAWLRHAVELDPSIRRPRTMLARLLMAGGNRDEAVRVLDDGLRREPEQRVWRRWRDSLAAVGTP